MNWQELTTESHYRAAVEIKHALQEGDVPAATTGIEELINALGRSERRALKGHLTRLMVHVIKWQAQPQRRSRSWAATIYNARDEIRDIQAETPSLTDDVLQALWGSCFRAAKREAEGDMNQAATVTGLSWHQVFEDDYELETGDTL